MQSLTNKINKMEYILHSNKIDIACVTEHWLNHDQIKAIKINGYKIDDCFCRRDYAHGGVLILSRDGLASKPFVIGEEPEDKHFEVCTAVFPKLKTVVITAYRSPTSDENIFLERLRHTLRGVTERQIEYTIIIAGDFNICINTEKQNGETLLDVIFEMGLHNAFVEASREDPNSRRCIDNIFLNAQKSEYTKAVVNLHMGDHLGQMVSLMLHAPKNEKQKVIIRNYNKKNLDNFKQLLDKSDWNKLYKQQLTAEECYREFQNILVKNFDMAFPKKIKVKTENDWKIQYKTEELLKMENQLQAIYVIIKSTRDNTLMPMYRDMKKQFSAKINTEKSKHYTRRLQTAENKQNTTWKIIKELTGKAERKVNETPLTADDFSRYFGDMGLCDGTSGESMNALDLMTSNNPATFFMTYTTPQEIEKIIKRIKRKPSKDIYEFSAGLIKDIQENISIPLAYLINKAIDDGIFPSALKKSRVVPIYKNGNSEECQNYRPISILPAISKIFETILKTRITSFLEKHEILTENQHAYQEGKSTITAMEAVLANIVTAFNNKKYTQISFCDLSKAFDSVDHGVLLNKLWKLGFRGKVHSLLTSYLSNRSQTVFWQNHASPETTTVRGVPQGSVLGPILFLVYVNDLVECVEADRVCLFADDTTFINSSTDMEELKKTTQSCLKQAGDWFDANKLQMNVNKTEILTLYTTQNANVTSKCVKFLGIHISETLNWSYHISKMRVRLNSAIYSLRMMEQNLGTEAAKIAYYSNFHSVASYGILIWGGSSEADVIFKLQKRAVRVMFGMHQRDSCKQIFKSEKILTLPCTFILACLLYVHRNRKQYKTNADYHTYDTRHKTDISLPYHRVKKAQTPMNHAALKLYNSIPPRTKGLRETHFKQTMKEFLLREAFYTVSEFVENQKLDL